MAQNTRTELKNKFKRGMYPTEGDFANVFDSYVHKDDMVEFEKVVQTIGNEQKTLASIINESKQEAIAAAVQQAGESEALTEIQNRLKTAEDDLDTAEDNIAGHETRIQTLETSKSDYEAFKERVRAFLEDADATDETINRWHEIESFLQGITDQETLTGLLADLKAEILGLIPKPTPEPAQQGNFIKQIADLDAYSEAYDGEIVQYVGQTTDSYTRGFFYERKAGDAKEILRLSDTPSTYNGGDVLEKSNESITIDKYYGYYAIAPVQQGNYMYDSKFKSYNVSSLTGDSPKYITLKNSNGASLGSGPLEEGVTCPIFIDQNNKKYFRISDSENWLVEISDDLTQLTGTIKATITKDSTPSSASWQHLHIDNVIS